MSQALCRPRSVQPPTSTTNWGLTAHRSIERGQVAKLRELMLPQSERCLLFPIEGDLSVFKSKEVVQIVVYRLPGTPRGRSTMHNRVDLGVSGGKRVYGLNSSTSSRRAERLEKGGHAVFAVANAIPRRGRRRGLGQPNPHRRWTSVEYGLDIPPPESLVGMAWIVLMFSSAPIEDSLRPRIDVDANCRASSSLGRVRLGCPARAELAHRPDAFGDSPGPAPGRRRKWHPWNTVIQPSALQTNGVRIPRQGALL